MEICRNWDSWMANNIQRTWKWGVNLCVTEFSPSFSISGRLALGLNQSIPNIWGQNAGLNIHGMISIIISMGIPPIKQPFGVY